MGLYACTAIILKMGLKLMGMTAIDNTVPMPKWKGLQFYVPRRYLPTFIEPPPPEKNLQEGRSKRLFENR